MSNLQNSSNPPKEKRRLPSRVVSRAKSAGPAGIAWLNSLEDTIAHLERQWQVSIGEALEGGSHAFVAPADGTQGEQFAVKIDMPESMGGDFQHDMEMLRRMNGRGYVKLYEYDPQHQACLMERLGKPINQLEMSVEEQIRAICPLLLLTWDHPIPPQEISKGNECVEWFQQFLPTMWQRLGHPCSQRVMSLTEVYLADRMVQADPNRFVLLHGDAHGGNTLETLTGDGYKFIDPDGIYNEPAYDLGVVMREWPEDYAVAPLDKGKERCALLSHLTGVAEDGIWAWGFLQTVSTGFVLLQVGQEHTGQAMLQAAEAWAD